MSHDANTKPRERHDHPSYDAGAIKRSPMADCRFVEREEFYRLAISSRHLSRCDDAEAGLRGLWDPQSGTRFMIEEEKLYARPAARGNQTPAAAEPQGLGA